MKITYIFAVILLFVTAASAQTRSPLPSSCEYFGTTGSAKSSFKFYLQPSSIKRDGDSVEIWTCLAPVKPTSYKKIYRMPVAMRYALQVYRLDCRTERYTTEPMIIFDKARKSLYGRYGVGSFEERIVPDSFADKVRERLCGGP